MADLKDLASRYGLEDYEQLLGGYPNATKFITGLKDAAVRSVPTTEQMRDPNFIIDAAGLGGAIKALKLHHGSDRIVPKVEQQGLFDAIFASPGRDAALSHGDKISNYYVNERKIGHDFGEKYDDTMTLLRHHYPNASDDDIENILYPAIAEDATPWNMNHEEVMRVTDMPDMGEASWKLQADRGKIGKALGYDAVKVRDEHGDSYMIPFGSKAKYRAGSLDELKEKYAEGGIVKAQDQNENLGKLAEMLGSARDVGNQYTVPSWVPLAGGVGAGDLLMGKTPEEIENWSYGNAPMQIPEMSNVPQFKRGRAQSLADALTTLAPGVKATEGLPVGLSFIGPKSRNWDKVAAELAAKKLDEGADPAEVWREHLIGRMPDKTLFSEISDKEMSHVIPLNKWVNKENGQFMAPNISTAWDEAASTLTPNAPVRIKRLFEHDQLKNEYPYGFTKNYENQSIMDMPVFMQEKNSKSYGSLGDGDLTLNPSLLPKEARSTVLHELQHAIQNQEGWGKGGSPEEFQLSDFAKSYWQNIYDKSNDQQSELLQSLLEKKKAGEIDNNDIRLQMESLANRNGRSIAETMLRRDKNPIQGYKRLTGEAQARATQDRLDMDMAQRRENYPLAGGKLSDIPLEDLIYKEGNGPSLSMDPLSKYKDYVGEHSAPLGDSGAPLHDLTANENAIYPSDVYSSKANQYYGSGEPEDAQLFAMAQRLKDKPNEKVSIYRAVPKMQSNSEKIAGLEKDLANYMKRGRMPKNADFDNKSDWYEWASNERDRLASLPEETIEPLSINHGDWVALDKKYAKEHGESALGGNYKILSKKVPARQLFTNGDSIREWGWDSRYAQGGSVDKDSDYGYGNRPDKTKKGLGYFGELERPDGTGVMTEYSIGVPINDKEMDIPTLVPTLTAEEVQHILNIKDGEHIPHNIVSKAIEHAHKRIKEGKPVFATEKDLYANGGSVVGDLPFNDPDKLRLYHQAMQHYDDVMENTGASKKMGKTEARINYNTTAKGDRNRDKDLHTLIADYGVDVGKGANINATMIKPMEAEGVYLGNLTGSVPVGEGRASLGLQGLHTKYSDGLSWYTAGYNGKVGDGNLSASYFEPADHNSAGRQVQLEYSMPFADGGSVSEFEDPAHERLYRKAMAHFDDLVNA